MKTDKDNAARIQTKIKYDVLNLLSNHFPKRINKYSGSPIITANSIPASNNI